MSHAAFSVKPGCNTNQQSAYSSPFSYVIPLHRKALSKAAAVAAIAAATTGGAGAAAGASGGADNDLDVGMMTQGGEWDAGSGSWSFKAAAASMRTEA